MRYTRSSTQSSARQPHKQPAVASDPYHYCVRDYGVIPVPLRPATWCLHRGNAAALVIENSLADYRTGAHGDHGAMRF